jgi:hypothetical protein
VHRSSSGPYLRTSIHPGSSPEASRTRRDLSVYRPAISSNGCHSHSVTYIAGVWMDQTTPIDINTCKKTVVKSQVTRTPRSSHGTKGVHEVFCPYRNPATFLQRINISTDVFQSLDAVVRIPNGSPSARFYSPATED